MDDIALMEHYVAKRGGKSAWKSAWSDIKSFMKEHGFVHSQYSGYESIGPMSYEEAYAILDDLRVQFPWFSKCAQVATLTEIGERHDVLAHYAQRDAMREQLRTSMPSPFPKRVTLVDAALDTINASKALSKEHIPEGTERRDER